MMHKIQIVFELIFTLEKSFRDKHSVGFVCYAYMQLHIIQVVFKTDLSAEIQDDGCLITIDILDYLSIEQDCITIITLVLLIYFSGNLILTKFSF